MVNKNRIDFDKVKKMYDEGLPLEIIGRRLGTSYNAIISFICAKRKQFKVKGLPNPFPKREKYRVQN